MYIYIVHILYNNAMHVYVCVQVVFSHLVYNAMVHFLTRCTIVWMQATRGVLTKEAPGLTIAMISGSLAVTPLAMLSRSPFLQIFLHMLQIIYLLYMKGKSNHQYNEGGIALLHVPLHIY